MTDVRFVCDRKNVKLFQLNSFKKIDYVPMIGDIIEASNSDLQYASFRVKPWIKEKTSIKNHVFLHFKVIRRSYCLMFNSWELLCEPTSECLIYLLRNIKVK